MKCKVEQKLENPLLKRVEISGTLIFDKATPSNTDLIKELAGQLKSKEETVLIRTIATDFGQSTAKFSAYIYKSEKDLKSYTPVTKHMKEAAKKAAEEAKKAEEKPAEEKPKEEKKAEEKKEEKPKEEKKAEEKKEEKPKEEKKAE